MTSNESSADTAKVDRPSLTIPRPGLPPGTSVGRYLIVDLVGEGGMGVVYKAYDPQLGRTVALKLVRTTHQGRLDTGGTLRERFLREARALALLSHPNVINVHDAGVFGDDVFIAMEFVEGPTLGRWLRTEPRSRDRILDVFLAAGAGLVAAHAAGLVHRDFKPDNVIVSSDGRVRVLDFGLARAVDAGDDASTLADAPLSRRQEDAKRPAPAASTTASPSSETSSGGKRTPAGSLSSLTEGGAIMGTPRFMAPEQHLGHAVDERADQFSFCVALYTALYGAAPFGGASILELTENVIVGKVSEVPAGSRVPRWLRAVLLRGLSVEPAARYPSMSALLAALRADPTIARGRWLQMGLVAAVMASAGLAWFSSHRSQTL
ncbi:MAG TPA: serine/threonine-protein kinase, partial [Polyangiaceae bacterium]